ncbi:hypothetical protein QYE76_024049 [Lolium multiflorum]|uniref:Uncharacterized protein n=1 Tax=Lolium multiflorum TaxID=4521 RepID=A0AAD8RCL7_LOLMU|nr:hypothetical protein QYE76_024049 [Lolium multiflorum]
MLKTAKVEIEKEHQVLVVNKTTNFKKQGKPKNNGNFKKGGKKYVAPPKKPNAGPQPDTMCFYCKGDEHWKRNCSKYLADLKNGNIKKKGETKWGHEVGTGWRGPSPGRAVLVCGPTRTPPTLPFRLLKVSVAKILPRSTKPEKTFSRRHREAKIGGHESLFARRRGKCPEGFSIDTTAIFINALSPMRRSSSPSRLGAVR